MSTTAAIGVIADRHGLLRPQTVAPLRAFTSQAEFDAYGDLDRG